MTHVEINGDAPSVEALHQAAAWGFGHYTSMQVRGRAVAGLDLHLARLREASAELFPDDPAPPDGMVIELIGHALRAERDASVRVTILPGMDVMVSVSAPAVETPRPPLRVRTVRFGRDLPHLKHRGTLAQTHLAMEARRAGFDDVLFLGPGDVISEGSVWNVVFWDGDRVVWPQAPMLAGITMQVLRRTLTSLDVPQITRPISLPETAGLPAAAATNSHFPDQAIQTIDEIDFPLYGHLTTILRKGWNAVPWQAIV
ncbi:aminotransferase class IV family protein [Actinoplanes sichuanensis]|uniref:Aminotransferase class IV n=1 Tax=Actinoplanes sichuanensis TaxID=512349 RepID=A0ABW4APC5_9ACTN|nr:aminotransferase class IV [Actinoplanes sichuanensis]BEL02956.1 aminotransferase class IV family protein [Actinoplanes sichuanensis]